MKQLFIRIFVALLIMLGVASAAGTAALIVTDGSIVGNGSTANPLKIAATGVTAGSYTLTNLMVNTDGQITAASSYAGSSCTSNTVFTALSAAGAVTCSTLASLNGAQGTGTTNQTVKWANTSGLLTNAWAIDDGTTWGVASKFTITEATGATTIGTGTAGLLTLDGYEYTTGASGGLFKSFGDSGTRYGVLYDSATDYLTVGSSTSNSSLSGTIENVRFNLLTGVTTATGQLLGKSGLYEGTTQDFADTTLSGLITKNLVYYSDDLRNGTLVKDATWGVVNYGSTLAYTDSTDVASPDAHPNVTSQVAKIVCTSGGTACSAGGSDFRFYATSATTGISDLRSLTMTFSVYVMTASGTTAINGIAGRYADNDQHFIFANCAVVATGWTRCSGTWTYSSTSYTDNSEIRIYLLPLTTTATYWSGAQLEIGSTVTPVEETDAVVSSGAYAYHGLGVNPPVLGQGGGGGGISGGNVTQTGLWGYTLGVGNTAENPNMVVSYDGSLFTKGEIVTTFGLSVTLGGATIKPSLLVSAAYAHATSTNVITSIDTSTIDTIGSALIEYGLNVSETTTRSAGSNNLTNRAAYLTASGGQVNQALYADAGDVVLNGSSGTTTINGNTTIGTSTSNAHTVNGQTVFQGATWSTIFNYTGASNGNAYIRAGGTAGNIYIGDVNTGGITIGQATNATTFGGNISQALTTSTAALGQTVTVTSGTSQYAVLNVISGGGAGNGFAARLDLQNTNGVIAEFRQADTGAGTAYTSEASMLTVSNGAGYGMKFNVNAADNSGIRIASGSPGAVTIYGNATIGITTSNNNAYNGRMIGNTTGFADGLTNTNTASAATYSLFSLEGTVTGTVDATAADRQGIAVYGVANLTRSTGAHNAINVGGYFTASGGQSNYALEADAGNVLLNNTSGTTTIDGATTIANTLTVQGASDSITIKSSNTATSQPGNNSFYNVQVLSSGSYDTTTGAVANYGVYSNDTETQAAGTHGVTNTAGYFNASGAQVNYALFTDSGNVVLNNTAGSTTIDGATTIANTLNVNGPTGVTAATITDSNTAQTSNVNLFVAQSTGTFDATAAARQVIAVLGTATSTRSAGANNLTNIGGVFTATSAQVNIALQTNDGNVVLNNNSGTTTIAGASLTLGTATTTFHEIDKDGTARPTVSGCGTSPSIVGTDKSGYVIVGTGGASSCTITFHTAYTQASCFMDTPATATKGTYTVPPVTSSIVYTAALGAAAKLVYECNDH